MSRRLLAIGDIHGCLKALETLLKAIVPGPEDTVVTLGDYIDRGPDSRGVIEQLIKLERSCQFVPLLGNHDETLLNVRAGRVSIYQFFDIGGLPTLTSYGTKYDLDLIPQSHYDFLERCRNDFETDAYIFLHANYDPDLPMNMQEIGTLRWESLRQTIPGPHGSGKVVIVGHSSQKSGEVLNLGHLICIDTYCYGGGWLTALDLTSGQIWQSNQQGELRETFIPLPGTER